MTIGSNKGLTFGWERLRGMKDESAAGIFQVYVYVIIYAYLEHGTSGPQIRD